VSTFNPKSSRVAGMSGDSLRFTKIMAFAGHADTQSPQPIHLSISTTAIAFFISTAHRKDGHQEFRAEFRIRPWLVVYVTAD
jgi:hypothetical protein